jgi:protein N-terminal glutamine amidohydrolase
MTELHEALRRGADLYAREAYFAAHEAWEERWRAAGDPDERRVLQGLIQVAAAHHKLRAQGKPESAARLLARGLAKLEPGPPALGGYAVAAFAAATRAWLATPGDGEAPPLLPYWPYYCEENVRRLCEHPATAGRAPAAVFVRSASGECLVWHQRAAAGPDEPVFWDYHVVLLVADPWEIWDLDSTLGCPTPAATWLRRSLRPELALPPSHRPRLRVVPAEAMIAGFASDRRHMRGPDGAWLSPPPPWPAFGPGSNLERFLAIDDPVAGEEHSLEELLARVRG